MTTETKPACNCTPEGDKARDRRPDLHQEHCAVLRWWAKARREVPWASCPAFYALPAGLDAVLTACDVTHQTMSAGDKQSLTDWLRLELARVDRTTTPLDRQFVAIDRRALEAILCGLGGPSQEHK